MKSRMKTEVPEIKNKPIYISFKRSKHIGQIIISKSSLQREKQIWNPNPNELGIERKAIKRNKHVQKLQPPPSTYEILELFFLPSFISHLGQRQTGHLRDCHFPRWHQIHKSQTLGVKTRVLPGSPTWTLKQNQNVCLRISSYPLAWIMWISRFYK